jgi:hypothetical protein
MPWRLVLGVAGIVFAVILLFSVTVGFRTSTAAKSSPATNSQVVGTPDSVDRVTVTPATAADLTNCHPNQPC